MPDSFFGYGSLVNATTYAYTNVRPATVRGWRRQWVQSSNGNIAFLSVTPDPFSAISGVIANVGDIGWDQLDEREAAYDRLELSSPHEGVQIYKASEDSIAPVNVGKPILLSYLDCVSQGFNTVFGADGVRDFFRSTTGWDTPILNDRATPIYPRACQLSPKETQMVDQNITMVGANLIHPT